MKNYKEIFDEMVNETATYLINNNLKTMVLGISGGLDSTVTAAICHEVELRFPQLRFIGVSLPCSSNSTEENDSASLCMKAFCKEGNYWTENIQKEYMLMKSTCELHTNSTDISQGNIKARLRMIYLYNLASTTGGLVMDTDNLTEHYLGFFTIHGDVADFNPIGSLWKHEVYELATCLRDYYREQMNYRSGDSFESYDEIEDRNSAELKVNALNAAIGIMPTDGNGVNNHGDMGQIAPAFVNSEETNISAYTKVDDIIKTYLDYENGVIERYEDAIEPLVEKYGTSTVAGIIDRIRNTEYKRTRLPIVPKIKSIN